MTAFEVLSMGASNFLSFSDFRHAVSSALSMAPPEGIDEAIADRMDAIEQAHFVSFLRRFSMIFNDFR